MSIVFQVDCYSLYNILIVKNECTSVYNQSVLPDENGTVMVTVDSGLESNEEYKFIVSIMESEIEYGLSGSFSKWVHSFCNCVHAC